MRKETIVTLDIDQLDKSMKRKFEVEIGDPYEGFRFMLEHDKSAEPSFVHTFFNPAFSRSSVAGPYARAIEKKLSMQVPAGMKRGFLNEDGPLPAIENMSLAELDDLPVSWNPIRCLPDGGIVIWGNYLRTPWSDRFPRQYMFDTVKLVKTIVEITSDFDLNDPVAEKTAFYLIEQSFDRGTDMIYKLTFGPSRRLMLVMSFQHGRKCVVMPTQSLLDFLLYTYGTGYLE